MKISFEQYKSFTYAILFLFHACNLAPGSYPYVERYEIDLPVEEVISKIESYKASNPDSIVPDVLKLNDGRRNEQDLWHHFYFYRKESDQIFKTWVRSIDNEKSTFALVAVFDGKFLNEIKFINKDFESGDNKKYISIFEDEILNNILDPLAAD